MTINIQGQSSKLLLSAIYLILAVINGWALKHHDGGQYSFAAFMLLFAHSVLSALRYTHPNAGHVQRAVGDQCVHFVPLIFVSLIVSQLLLIIDKFDQLWVFGTALIYVANLLAAIIVWRGRIDLQQHCTNACVLWNIVFLTWIFIAHSDCYWTIGLATLVFLNHFILWRLKLHFSISQSEVSTVGLCFFVLFAINTVDEVSEMHQHVNMIIR